jgi:predicted nucleotidyltransferase component of viral defense system
MIGSAMSLKAKIRNLARMKDMSAQVVLQNYMFERFLERLSRSRYRDRFILKGGMLIASLVGIANRSTMDMDVTIKDYPFNIESLIKAINEICNITIDDGVSFFF